MCKQLVPVLCSLASFVTVSSVALAGNYYIDDNVDWSDLSPQPTSVDVIYVYDDGELTIDVNNAECAALYIGYESGSYTGDGTVEFKKNSILTVYSVDGVTVGTSSYDGEIDMDDGGTLVTSSITVLSSDSELESGKGTVMLTGNNVLPAEFNKYYHLVISAGTTELSGDIGIKGDLTILGILDVSSANHEIKIKGDWINSGTFVQRNGAVIFAGKDEQTVSGTNATIFHALELDKTQKKKNNKNNKKSKGVVLSSGISVLDKFVLTKGVLYTDTTNYITLKPKATTLGGSDGSHVNGRIKIEIDPDTVRTIVINTGKNGNHKKAVLNTQSTDATEFYVEYFDQPHLNSNSTGSGLTHVCQMQYWELERITGTAVADLTLFWSNNGCGPMDIMPALEVARYDSTLWSAVGANSISGTPQMGSVTSDTLTSFGCFTFGCNHGSLKTSGGYDNFSSNEDAEEPEESPLTLIEIEQNTKVPVYDLDMIILPNPSQGKVNVTLNGDMGKEVLIVVNDMLGRIHYSKVVLLENDTFEFAIDPSEKLTPGVYLVVGSSENRLYKRKIVIQ
ncbi:MAG: T9SS type A sorting domain-containing protein [Flavobacteriales bacterium]|nr:T9SS type A sorting domain-containing protein [Flavobacteriales bacterium]